MTPSAYAAYRDRVTALITPGALDECLTAWCVARGVVPPSRWDRDYGRFHPGQSPWAVLALVGSAGSGAPGDCETSGGVTGAAGVTGATTAPPATHVAGAAGGGRVDVTVRVDVHEERCGTAAVSLPGIGWAQIRDVTEDERLPGLATVLSSLSESRVVRYRPGNRCTVSGVTTRGRRFVKVTPGAQRLQADAVAVSAAARSGTLPFAVAEPLGWDEKTSSSWYGVVPGDPIVATVLGADGAAVVERLGAALGALSLAPLSSTVTIGPAEQLARTARTVARAESIAPWLGGELRGTLAELAGRHDDLSVLPPLPVHGAPHVHQWLDDHGALGLVDFDRFGMGDPELDLATFLAELDSDADLTLPIEALETALVAGFEQTGRPLDPARLELYRAHKRLAKVARTAYALRPDGDLRAAKHLARLRSSLAASTVL